VEGIKKLLDDPWFTSTFKGINLTFWGGEPTINPQGMWPFVAAFAGRSNVHWHIYTNGTRPDVLEELVTRLEVQRALKRLSVQISYDGKPVHDKHRLMRTGEPTSEQVQMGVAMLKNPSKCLALLGKNVNLEDISEILTHSNKNEREQKVLDDLKEYVGKPCTICADLCPYPAKDKAIAMVSDNKGNFYPEIRSECVGCGVCEELCPVKDEAAIVIIPRVKYEEIYS
jgi:NAD-dependent dihydropyrimidine dehydrogenase PreA subunit